jgi:membrane-associated phospholipid phosphatase
LVRGLFCSLAIFVALTTSATRAHAEGKRPGVVLDNGAAEAAVASLCAASNLTIFIRQRESGWGPSLVRKPDTAVGVVSDVFGAVGGIFIQTGVGYVLESGYLNAAGADDPGVEALFGTLVETESFLLSSGVTQLIKRISGRCRPRAWLDGKCTEFNSFPSGHTSAISPFAGARLVRLAQTPRDGDGIEFRAANYAVAETTTIGVAFMRVAAGAHNWEDVLAGGIIGHATGVLIALIHPPVDVEPGSRSGASAGALKGPKSVPTTSFSMTFEF